MNMLYEAIKEKGSMVIVPSSAVETMGLGGLTGVTALAQKKEEGRRKKTSGGRHLLQEVNGVGGCEEDAHRGVPPPRSLSQ